MAAVPSPAASHSLRLAAAGDFDAYMDAFDAVAAEGRWMGAEAPIDRDARRAGFDRAVEGDNSVLFLADAGGPIIGSIYASVSGGVVDLGMFVVSGHRGGGIGSALLEAVIDWARAQQAHKVSLAVWPTNYPAIGLYARYGFQVEGTRRRHYRRRNGEVWDATWMGLILDHDIPGGPGPSKPERAPLVVPEGGIRGPDGSGIMLREWRRTDIPALVATIDDPEIRRTLPHIPHPYTEADAEEFLAGTRVDQTDGKALPVVIEVDGALAGSIDLRLPETFDGTLAEMGYWVAAPVRGRGVASTAARLLADWGFEALGLRRVELNAALDNPASRRVAENAGFELEGIRRSWRSVAGVPTDFAHYARLADSG